MTSNDEKPELIRVAEAISDGVILDWDAEERAADRQATVPTNKIATGRPHHNNKRWQRETSR